MDFRNVSRLFADPEFDGDPEVIYEVPKDGELPDETNEPGGTPDTNTPSPTGLPGGNSDEDDYYAKTQKYRVNDVDVRISNERVYYYDVGGKLITENLIDYTKRNIRSEYATLEEFLRKWKSTEQKQSLLDELKKHGVLLEALFDEEPHLKDLDEFDLICHLAYDQKPLTKAERANNVKNVVISISIKMWLVMSSNYCLISTKMKGSKKLTALPFLNSQSFSVSVVHLKSLRLLVEKRVFKCIKTIKR